MAVHVADHPLIKHKLGLMRQHDISTKDFRDLSSEVARLLTYEATKDLQTRRKTIQGWAGPVEVDSLKGKKITVDLYQLRKELAQPIDGVSASEIIRIAELAKAPVES